MIGEAILKFQEELKDLRIKYDGLKIDSLLDLLSITDISSRTSETIEELEQCVLGGIASFNMLVRQNLHCTINDAIDIFDKIFEAYQHEYTKKGIVALPTEMMYLQIPVVQFTYSNESGDIGVCTDEKPTHCANVYELFSNENISSIAENMREVFGKAHSLLESLFYSQTHIRALNLFRMLRDEDLENDCDKSELYDQIIEDEMKLIENCVEMWNSIVNGLELAIVNMINFNTQCKEYCALEC